MTNPETTNTVNDDLRNLWQRLSTIQQEWKDSILYLLNNLEENKKTLIKINNNQIITQKEYIDCVKFLEICGYHWPSNLLGIMKLIWGSDHKDNMNRIYPFVKDYPFVVDADEVREDIASQLGEWIAEIRKNGKWWLVRKGEATWIREMMTLFDPKYWIEWWVLTFSEEEYEKYGLIEVRHYYDKINPRIYNVMFLQKIQYPNSKYNEFYFKNIWRYEMLQSFDRDGIWFCMYWWWQYGMLHKEISSQWIKIYELWVNIDSNWDTILKWFDSFNTFETEMKGLWKVTLKKSYDDSWKLRWISAFKKKRFGWEEQVRARDKEH